MTILPGVAIAVAVVPPLLVVGYGLSTHQGSIAGGAFLLFITNLVAIVISAVVVFRLIGFQPRKRSRARPVEAEIPSGNQHIGIDSSFHPALSNSAPSRHRDSRTVPFVAGAEGLL